MLSGTAAALDAGIPVEHSSVITAKAAKVKNAATKLTITATAGTLGAPITFTATVRAAVAEGAPTGSVELISDRMVVENLTLAAATSTSPKFAVSQGTFTLTFQPGSSALFIGRHPIGAQYVPSGAFSKSKASVNVIVAKPSYTALANGVKYETITAGSGVGIQPGQYAEMLYTGYLAKNGKIFDDSANHATNGVVSPFPFQVDASPMEQVIPGFDEGAVGMEVGETRLVYIPPAEGYGKKANGSIPGNSTLLFEITLESISDTNPSSS
jgi:hypothetical protein